MKIVIDIPEEIYQKIKETNMVISGRRNGKCIDYILFNATANGTPLPKGHGDLIEANENLFQSIRKWCGKDKAFEILNNAPIIIEADKKEE